ncbi:MAG: RNA-protein complex protein Nop10 [Thermoplasmata archaeon]|nr:RNA-protein complex protein Nop10 [Thermoplasmata archaeon]
MRTAIRRCKGCDVFTLKEHCSKCGSQTVMALPPRYSPEDKYGDYRRKLKKLKARSS